jgi:hypothetical protein
MPSLPPVRFPLHSSTTSQWFIQGGTVREEEEDQQVTGKRKKGGKWRVNVTKVHDIHL